MTDMPNESYEGLVIYKKNFLKEIKFGNFVALDIEEGKIKEIYTK